jgi:lariat debranching enzyme
LHVRFAALVKHSGEATQVGNLNRPKHIEATEPVRPEEVSIDESVETKPAGNTEEMTIDMSDGEGEDTVATSLNPEQIDMDEEEFDEEPAGAHQHEHAASADQEGKKVETAGEAGSTRFLALSKCLEGQDFLQILDVPAPFDVDDRYRRETATRREGGQEQEQAQETSQPSFRFNRTWLAVARATHGFLSLEKKQKELPKESSMRTQVKAEEAWLKTRLKDLGKEDDAFLDVEAVQQFVKTAPATNDANGNMNGPRE